MGAAVMMMRMYGAWMNMDLVQSVVVMGENECEKEHQALLLGKLFFHCGLVEMWA